MTAQELRLGNLVNYSVNGEALHFGKITGLYNTDDEQRKGVIDYHYPLLFGQPIPLTPEILEKCGFEKYYDPQKDHRREWWSIAHFTLEVYNAKIEFVSLTSNQRLFVQYLHQLQNLYYALTGEELEIKF